MTKNTRVVSADDAIAEIAPGSVIALTGLSSEPLALLEALARRVANGDDAYTLLTGMMLDGYHALAPHLGNEVRLETWFMPQTLLGNVELGPRVDFLPMTWAQVIRHIDTRGFDVGFVQVSPADVDGNHSLGVSVSLNRSIVDRSKILIAQVNQHMPFTYGPDSVVHRSEIDFLVEDSRQLRSFPHRQPDERDKAIAVHVAELIESDSTIQVGIGTIPSQVLRILASSDRSGLRITSQVTDAVRDLIESGRCSDDSPVAVVGDVLGGQELYEWVHRNDRVHLVSGRRTHGLSALSRAPKFVSINSTLEIDLYGQINSEVLGSGQAGGIGGSLDFMMGAQFDNNRSIVTLPSTTSSGVSRIVASMRGAIVTVPRSLVQFVVTEYGAVDLRDMNQRERAAALVTIAHPDHRPALSAAAAELG